MRYDSTLLHTLEPGPEIGKQQQQAALGFVQAQCGGASTGAVAAAQRQAVLTNLRQALELVVIPAPGEPDPPAPQRRVLLPLWTAQFEQRSYHVAVVLAVRQPEAVAASLLNRDRLPLDRASLLWLSHTLEAERATR